jgi:hypothetical protein
MLIRHLATRQTSWMVFLALLMLATVPVTLAQPPAATPAELEGKVKAFVEAYNAHQIETMMALADDTIQWLTVEGTGVAVEANGKDALKLTILQYWSGCASCHSKLRWTQSSATRVVALEEASWTNKDGQEKSQQSLSVYEFRDDKIVRVYYFPAEKVDAG